MAVPKRKTSKARRDSRRSSLWKLTAPSIVECPQCHQPVLAHHACSKCGYYDAQQVLNVESSDKKKAKA